MTQRDTNPFPYSNDNKRYLTYSYYLKKRFGKKVYKVPLNCGFGCPNRDGTKGTGGCIFCSAKLSGDFGGNPEDDIAVQYENQRKVMSKKWADGLCIPYFQAGSNTYADISVLKPLFEKAISLENAVGLSIATRADCLDEEKCDMLAKLSKKTYLTVELGLQSIYDETARLCNRCHSFEDFMHGFDMLKKRRINVCVHIIDGLPFETQDMMLETARVCAGLGLHAIKIHLLHVIRGTKLADMYEQGEFDALGRQEYINTLCNQLEVLPKEVIIERVTGDGAWKDLVAPKWSTDKFGVMNDIDKELLRRNSWQGKFFKA